MLFRGGRDHAPVRVDDQRASAAGADIDAEELDNSLLFARPFSIACRAEVVDQFCNLFARAGKVPNYSFPSTASGRVCGAGRVQVDEQLLPGESGRIAVAITRIVRSTTCSDVAALGRLGELPCVGKRHAAL